MDETQVRNRYKEGSSVHFRGENRQVVALHLFELSPEQQLWALSLSGIDDLVAVSLVEEETAQQQLAPPPEEEPTNAKPTEGIPPAPDTIRDVDLVARVEALRAVSTIPPPPAEIPSTPLPIDPVAIEPGMIGQLYVRLPFSAKLVDLVLDPGCSGTRVIAGSNMIEPPGEGQKWRDVLGQVLGTGTFLTVLGRNDTDEVRALGGTWHFQLHAGKVQAEKVQNTPTARSISPTAGGRSSALTSSGNSPSPTPVEKRESDTVTPGQNEVAILLKKGDAERLLQVIRKGYPLQEVEKPGFERAIADGLKRSAR